MSSEPQEVETERMPAKRDGEALVERQGEVPTIERLLAAAIDKGTSVEGLEKLVTLYERMADRRAASEFAGALAEFQAACPPIPKTSRANILTKSGVRIEYSYAELDEIAATAGPHLHRLGLSYTWDSEVSADRIVTGTCTLRHHNGHSITAKFSAPIDAGGVMNETQKVSAALSYAKRQALIQVLGLTTTEPDSDVVTVDKITAEQKASLRALLQETRSDVDKFMVWMRVGSIDNILQSDYGRAVAALEQKRKQGASHD